MLLFRNKQTNIELTELNFLQKDYIKEHVNFIYFIKFEFLCITYYKHVHACF